MLILECTKTGRHWRGLASEAAARRLAIALGLTDYTVEPA